LGGGGAPRGRGSPTERGGGGVWGCWWGGGHRERGGAAGGGGGGGGCRVAAFLSSPNQNLKNTDFAHAMTSNVSRHLPFTKISHRNWLMTSILKFKKCNVENRMTSQIKLIKITDIVIYIRWVMEYTVIFIHI